MHLKDVRPIDAAPGYQWVELGRGRVDVKGCVAALKDVGFDDRRRSRRIAEGERLRNRDYAVNELGLTLLSEAGGAMRGAGRPIPRDAVWNTAREYS